MKVTKPELAPILHQGRRTALLPLSDDGVTPHGRHRVHRKGGPIVTYVHIQAASLVGPLDKYVTDKYAHKAGHPDVQAYMDDWCRTHKAVWTGAMAWEVTFTLEPWREQVQPMRGPWDPGSGAEDVGGDRRRAPEPEKVPTSELTREAQRRWELDQQQREALYRSLPAAEKLRMVQEDARLRVAGRNDLRVIEQRLEAIWNRGKKAA